MNHMLFVGRNLDIALNVFHPACRGKIEDLRQMLKNIQYMNKSNPPSEFTKTENNNTSDTRQF